MKPQLSRNTFLRSTFAVGLIFPFTSTAQTPTPPPLYSSSNSYGLLDAFNLTPKPDAPSLPSAPTPQHTPTHRVETSISLGAFPDLTATRFQTLNTGSLTTQSLTPSAGVLGTFRQQFTPWLGYSVNMGYTRNSLHDTAGAGPGSANTYSNLYIANNVYELSLSYVAEKHITPKLSAFFDVGAGMLAFLPEPHPSNSTNTYILATKAPVSFRPLGVGGLGIDYHFAPSFSFRAEYRSQLYKFPDYGIGLPRMSTVSSQPTFSLAYTFHPKKKP